MGESSRSHSDSQLESVESVEHTLHTHMHTHPHSLLQNIPAEAQFVFCIQVSFHTCVHLTSSSDKAAQRPEEAILSPLSFPVCVCANAHLCAALAVVSWASFGFGVLFGDRISRWLAVQQIRYMPVSTTQHWNWDYKSVLCFPLKKTLTYSLVI